MKRITNEKGVITIVTLVTVLFMVSFLITSYSLVANKVKTQKEILIETKKIYEPKYTMEEIYNSYLSNENTIPIYTTDQLLSIDSTKDGNIMININNKYYKFTNTSIYVLMNDIEFNSIDLNLQSDWVPTDKNTDFKGTFDWNKHTVKVTKLDGTTVLYGETTTVSGE